LALKELLYLLRSCSLGQRLEVRLRFSDVDCYLAIDGSD